MSLRGYRFCRNALSISVQARTNITLPRSYFSICTKLQKEKRKPSHAATEHDPSEANKHNGQREQQSNNSPPPPPPPRRSRLPAFAPFLLAIPIGWYLQPDLFSSHLNKSTRSFASPSEFVEYTLTGKDAISSTCSIFRLRPSSAKANSSRGEKLLDIDDPALARAITSVQFKQPQLQIARAYTLLPHADGQHIDELRFLIRRERGGEVSGFLHGLTLGAGIELRGPKAEYVVPEGVGRVLFIAGGTGIAPAMQMVDVLEGEAEVRILWGNRRREDCVGGISDTVKRGGGWWRWGWWGGGQSAGQVKETGRKGEIVRRLDNMKEEIVTMSEQHNGQLRVDYYVDDEGSYIRPADVKHAVASLQQSNRGDSSTKSLIVVSGPDGFINHWAGPKKWVNGRETQGPLGGILAELDLHEWHVVKL